MKSIQAQYDPSNGKITIIPSAEQENWVDVCRRFNDDVSRVCNAEGIDDYTGLFECFDEKNQSVFYLVKEDKTLYRMKHRHFLDNLGLSKS